MRKLIVIVCGIFLSTIGISQNKEKEIVVMATSYGEIRIELYPEKAPKTVNNFLKYVDAELYDSSEFYRVVRMNNQPNSDVKIEVIQGGLSGKEVERFKPIEHETTELTGVKHENGTISMARNEPGSASSEFFICIGNQPSLDFGGLRNSDLQGFSAFGKVISGIEIVKLIQQGQTEDQYLKNRVVILSISR